MKRIFTVLLLASIVVGCHSQRPVRIVESDIIGIYYFPFTGKPIILTNQRDISTVVKWINDTIRASRSAIDIPAPVNPIILRTRSTGSYTVFISNEIQDASMPQGDFSSNDVTTISFDGALALTVNRPKLLISTIPSTASHSRE